MNFARNGRVAAIFGGGLLVGLLIGVGVLVGAWSTRVMDGRPLLMLPETALHATGADSNDNFAVATGFMDENVEGLFMLDGLTGNLRCVALNHRVAKFTALFQTNVLADLGIEGKPKFLLATGAVNFRGPGTARPARTVVYVIDAATGRYAAYAVPFRSELASQARPQTGVLALLDIGEARTAVIRE